MCWRVDRILLCAGHTAQCCPDRAEPGTAPHANGTRTGTSNVRRRPATSSGAGTRVLRPAT
jgi:hypothetical protein